MTLPTPKVFPTNHCTPGFLVYSWTTKWNPIPMPVNWSPETRSFTHKNLYCYKYIPWYLSIFGLMGIGGISCASYSILNSAGVEKVITSITWILFSLSVCVPAWYLCSNWIAFVQAFESYTQLTEILDSLYPKAGREYRKDKTWKRLSILLQVQMGLLTSIPIVLVPGFVYHNLDPFSLPFQKLFCFNSLCSQGIRIAIFALRAVVVSVCVVESCRFVVIYYHCPIYILERQMHCLHMLSRIPPKPDPLYNLVYLKWYKVLQICDRTCNEGFSMIVGVGFICGFGLWVFANVTSIKCYNILPLSLYLLMPLTSLVTCALANVSLPALVRCPFECEQQLYGIKLHLTNTKGIRGNTQWNRKMIRRRLKISRPIALKFAGFFAFRKELKSTYNYDVFQRTIDGVMIPLGY